MPHPSANPLPIQFTPFRKEDFTSEAGVSFVNQTLSQLTTTLNAMVGAGGPTLLPSGVDVRGASVTGLGLPNSPTDAVSLAHANANYGAEAQSSKLDVGGPNALKGLSYLFLKAQQQSQAAQPSYSGSGSYFALYGMLIQWGYIAAFDTGPTTVTFPKAFPNACFGAWPVGDWSSNNAARIWFVSGLTQTSFQAHNDGLQGAWWWSLGW